jgi:diacylglycerol kinase family enzyme
MFFVNPISGGGKAVKIMNKNIIPLLRKNGVHFDHLVTTHAGHAKEWIQEQSGVSDCYDGYA